MLTHLHVKNFTLVDNLNLDFAAGLTALTGETGAGKSILLDALQLALGDRADADKIKAGADRAEVSASFDIASLSQVKAWLQDADLDSEECLVRRVITREGRSRAYVNGQMVTLTQLRALGEKLIDLHSQHEHQSLLKVVNHRVLLDSYGKHDDLAARVKQAFQQWQAHQLALEQLREGSAEADARYQLLKYQVEELDQLGLSPGEVADLEVSQKKLENAVITQQSCRQVMDLCSEGDDSIQHWLQKASQVLAGLPYKSPRVTDVLGMLENAAIQVEEAGRELTHELDMDDLDANNLPEIEQRLSAIYDIARKHRVAPEALTELHNQLADELSGLQSSDEQLEHLEQLVDQSLHDYQKLAQALSRARAEAAKKLAHAVNRQLSGLAMAHASFQIALNPTEAPTRHGNDLVEFLIATVPGQPAKSLIKIASGGELSRVSLAIQVVAAKISVTPTLVFDEVDVGIGGATGDVVGRMLRELGDATQVICVTHLAQVASKAHHHLRVEKTVSKKAASTHIQKLGGEDQVLEIARMMGGAIESEQSLAHAREMLALA